MMPIEFEGSQWIGKPQNMTDEQCSGVYAAKGVDVAGFHYFLTAWKPNKEDLEALNKGEPILIKSLSQQLVPMAVFTVNEEGEPNDE